MSDALPTTPVTDQINAIDIATMMIDPIAQTVSYTLRLTWQSGKITAKQGLVTPADFASCLTAWCQATPKKKFLSWLVSANYETNLTPQ